MYVDEACLDHTGRTIIDTVHQLGGSVDALRDNWEQALACIDANQVGQCLGRYLEAEFDVTTPGDRGLGRISTYIPRLGAHYRKKLRALRDAEVEQLKSLVTSLLVKSYVFAAIHSSRKPSTRDVEALYRQWITKIYTLDLRGELGGLRDRLDAVVGEEVTALREAVQTHAVRIRILRPDKFDVIIQGYLAAGISLYFAQVV